MADRFSQTVQILTRVGPVAAPLLGGVRAADDLMTPGLLQRASISELRPFVLWRQDLDHRSFTSVSGNIALFGTTTGITDPRDPTRDLSMQYQVSGAHAGHQAILFSGMYAVTVNLRVTSGTDRAVGINVDEGLRTIADAVAVEDVSEVPSAALFWFGYVEAGKFIYVTTTGTSPMSTSLTMFRVQKLGG